MDTTDMISIAGPSVSSGSGARRPWDEALRAAGTRMVLNHCAVARDWKRTIT